MANQFNKNQTNEQSQAQPSDGNTPFWCSLWSAISVGRPPEKDTQTKYNELCQEIENTQVVLDVALDKYKRYTVSKINLANEWNENFKTLQDLEKHQQANQSDVLQLKKSIAKIETTVIELNDILNELPKTHASIKRITDQLQKSKDLSDLHAQKVSFVTNKMQGRKKAIEELTAKQTGIMATLDALDDAAEAGNAKELIPALEKKIAEDKQKAEALKIQLSKELELELLQSERIYYSFR